MSSGDVHDGEHEGEEKGGGEASSLKEDDGRVQSGDGSSAVQHEDKLGEEWPQIEVDRGKGFVVCTIDTQLLSGGFCLLMGPSAVAMKGLFGRTWCKHSSRGYCSSACVPSLVCFQLLALYGA